MNSDSSDDASGTGLSDASRAKAGLVADVLERRASASGAAARQAMAARFRAVARNDGEPDPTVADILGVVEELAPGGWPGTERTSVSDDELALMARTMDRVEARRRHRREAATAARESRSVPAPSSTDPAADWAREIWALLGDPATVDRALLTRIGMTDELPADPARWSLEAGPDRARELVELAGGRWDEGDGLYGGGSYANLYRAARMAGGWDDPSAPAPDKASGVLSTSTAMSPVVSGVVFTDDVRPARRVRGRTTMVHALASAVCDGRAICEVLVGEAGMGKTTIAAEVARRVMDMGFPAYWISAPERSALIAGLEQVALARDVPLSSLQAAHGRSSVPEEYVEALWRLLAVQQPTERWLLVLDDTTWEVVGGGPRRAGGSGAIVITTRGGTGMQWAPARVQRVTELSRFHAEQVVLDRFELAGHESGRPSIGTTARGEELASRLCDLLPGLPLALASVGDLLARSGRPDLDRIDRIATETGGDPVSAVYEVCLDALGRDRDRGRVLLRLLACFAADEPVPERILIRPGALTEGLAARPDEVPGPSVGGLGDGDTAEGIAALVKVGLVERAGPHGARAALRVHPAIAEHSRRDYGDGPVTLFLDTLALHLLEIERGQIDAGQPGDWPAVVAIEPHVHELVTSPALGAWRVEPEIGARVLALADRTSTALMRSGRHECATALLDGAIDGYRWLGSEHPSVLAARLTRAWITALDRGGDLPRARILLEELAATCERVLGPEAEVTISVLDTLGWVLAEQDALVEARHMLTLVVRRRDEQGPGGRRAALASRHRLAWVRVMLGEGPAAVEEFEEVLAERTRTLGSPDHLDVLSTRYRLAWALSRLGAHGPAREQFAALLDASERILGHDHPLTLMVRSRVAWAAMWAGELRAAKEMYSELLPTQEKVLGVVHRRVLVNAHNLAVLTMRLGDPATAEEELRRIVLAREELLGSDHPYSMESREMHAWALFRSGRAEEADRELVALLADRRRVLGDEHLATFDARFRIARVVLHRGRLSDAEGRLRALAADRVAPTSWMDRRNLQVQHALALALGLQGAHREASTILRTVLGAQTLEFGPDDEDTLATRDRLVWLDGAAGRHERLVDAARGVLDDRVRLLGSDHPHTATSRYRLAWALLQVGRLPSAARAYEDLVHDLELLRGRTHPHTVRARIGRLQLWRMTRRVGEVEAEAEADDLVRLVTVTQGSLAVATLRAEEERAQIAAVLGQLGDAALRLRDVRVRQRRVLGSNHLDVLRLYRLEGGVRGGPVPTPDSYPVR